MIKTELLRIVKSRLTWICLILLVIYYSVISFAFVLPQISIGRDIDTDVNVFLPELNGVPTDEIIRVLQHEKDGFPVTNQSSDNADKTQSQNRKFRKIFDENDYNAVIAKERVKYLLIDYPKLMADTVNMALKSKNESSDAYNIRKQDKIISVYNTARKFDILPESGAEIYFQMRGSYINFYFFICFSVLVISVTAFTAERSNGMEKLVFATPYGRRKLYLAKYFSVIITAAAIVILFLAFDLAIAIYSMGTDMLFQPIQAIKSFKACQFSLSVIEVIMAKHLILMLPLILIISVSAFVGAIARRGFVSLILSAFPVITETAVYVIFRNSTVDNDSLATFNLSNIREFISASLVYEIPYFEKFDCANLLGFPIERLYICSTFTIILILIFAISGALFFGKPKFLKG